MFVLYSFLLALVMGIISYPYLKFYQLNGYNIKVFLEDIFNCPFKLDDKNKLVFTKRMTRFVVLYLVVLFCLFLPVFLFISNFGLIFLDIVVIGIILPLLISFAHLLICPVEIMIKKNYIKKTKRILSEFKGIKIAVVGSYGKTSVKNILSQILSTKFNVLATPKNYNTPMGIARTVLERKTDPDVMIFEMGARKEGDIKQLMEIVNPDWGIMTAVGAQHLDTFKDLDTIKRTKFELVKHMKRNGKILFNNLSESTRQLYKKCDKVKFFIGNKQGVAWAENLSYSTNGLEFDLCVDEERARVSTCLLGKFNCQNIVLASAMAYMLGVEFADIVKSISNLTPTKNRLELLDMGNFLIIDDSYNANIEGAKEALDVLLLFEGIKIVVTSGLVELGSLQYEKNFVLGKQIGKVADTVLIMNETNKKAILAGLKQAGLKNENIYFACSREEQKRILSSIVKPKSVVLFQNDLPDNYK